MGRTKRRRLAVPRVPGGRVGRRASAPGLESLEPRLVLAPVFSIAFEGPGFSDAQRAAIASNLRAAADDWGRHIDSDASIEIAVSLAVPGDGVTRATGYSETSVFLRTEGGRNYWRWGVTHELITGIDPNGATPDMRIKFETPYFTNELWFDPAPAARTATVPADRTDAYSVLLHEVGHGLGFNGWNTPEGQLTGDVSPFDAHVTVVAGQPYFVGPKAVAVYGGGVPVTRGVPSHVGNASGPGTDLVPDLMNGVVYYRGSRYLISALDLAILADTGTPILGGTDVFARTAGGTWMVSRNDGGLSTPRAFGQWAESAGWRDVSQGDFNADGLTDVVGRTAGGEWYVGLNNGSGFVNTRFGRWNAGALWHDVRYGDFDGDGRTDVAGRSSNGEWYVGISNGISFVTSLWVRWSEGAGWRDVAAGDFDGDGRDDLAGRASNGRWYVARSTGGAFATGLWGSWNEAALWRDVLVADFDGNGRADVAGRTSGGEWYVGLSIGGVGTGAFSTLRWARWNEAAGWRGVTVGDFAGDGRIDILGRTSGGQFYVAQNLGGSSFGTIPFGRWNEGDWRTVLAGDFAGDGGRADVLGRAADGTWWLGENNGTGLAFRRYGVWNEAAGWRDVTASGTVFVAAASGGGAAPGFSAPGFSAPGFSAPGFSAPGFSAPVRTTPTLVATAQGGGTAAAFAPVRPATADAVAVPPPEEQDEEEAPPAFAGAERPDLFHAVFADGDFADALVAV